MSNRCMSSRGSRTLKTSPLPVAGRPILLLYFADIRSTYNPLAYICKRRDGPLATSRPDFSNRNRSAVPMSDSSLATVFRFLNRRDR